MKKSYLEPETTIVKMRHALLSGSEARSIGGNADLRNGGGGNGEARSRGIWDRWDD